MVGNRSVLALSLQREWCTQVRKGEEKSGWWLKERTKGLIPGISKELDETLPVVKPSFDIMFPSAKLTESWVDVNRVSDSSRSSMPPVAFTWLG